MSPPALREASGHFRVATNLPPVFSTAFGATVLVDVFEQVEEELRSERYKRLARTWLPIGAGVGAIALIGALGWWGYQSWQTNEGDKASAAYQRGIEAAAAGDMAKANTEFGAAADTGSRGYKALALMQQAAIALSQDKTDEAIRLFDEAAKASGDPILSDGAAIKAVYLVMDKGDLDGASKRLETLVDDKRPYRALAQEAQATVLMLKNKPAEAREIFVQLQLGQEVPQSVRQRAQTAVRLIDSGTSGSVAAIVAEARKAKPEAAPAAAAAAAPATAEQPAPAQPAQAQPAQAQ